MRYYLHTCVLSIQGFGHKGVNNWLRSNVFFGFVLSKGRLVRHENTIELGVKFPLSRKLETSAEVPTNSWFLTYYNIPDETKALSHINRVMSVLPSFTPKIYNSFKHR